MTKEIEVLKMALEFAEDHLRHWSGVGRSGREVVAAIKEVLDKPEPWEKFCDSNCVWTDHHPNCKLAEQEQRNLSEQEHDVLMSAIKASSTFVSKGFLAQPEQEPVACDGDFPEGFDASLGVPAQALRVANAIMCDVIGKREWDVPCTAQHVLSFAKKYTTPPQPWEKFCDSNCVWTDHHPDCKLAEQEPVAAAKKDEVFAASIEFIGTLTGMTPPPIEIAPPEVFKPFRDFTEKVCLILNTTPPQRKPLTDEEIEDLYFDNFSMGELKAFARAIESAHGIENKA